MRNKINTIVASMLLVLCVAVSMFTVNVSAAEETTTPIDNCDRIVETYDWEDAEGYINDGDASTYPTTDTEGYIFAGWYTDKSCGEDSYWGQEEPGDTVYALFVPSHILSVKAQVSSNLLDKNTENDGEASIRFVTTVDTLLYTQVGFKLSYIGSDGTTKNATSSSKEVYKHLYAIGSTSEEYKEEGVVEYTPQGQFCRLSTYFKACVVNGIKQAYYDTKFTVKPFWITLDGSKVYGETVEKSISDYFDAEEVWVSAEGTNSPLGYGTYAKPYETLDYAIEHVKDGGTVHVIGDMTIAADATWTAHGKAITITNDGQDAKTGTLTFTAGTVDINDSVKFTDMGLNFAYYAESTDSDGNVTKDYADVYAWGNKIEIDSDVSGLAEPITVYGGGSSKITSDTELILRAGTYHKIYGGGTAAVTGSTSITVGGTANTSENINYKDHDFPAGYNAFGGGNGAAVTGNTKVIVETTSNRFNYIYGGGQKGAVTGDCIVEFNGLAMSVFGGSYGAKVTGDTCVTMENGWVEQLFGGCQSATMEGNANVYALGGTVYRRIYGGCYNELNEDTDKWASDYYVTGHTGVTIDDAADVSLEYTKTVLSFYDIEVDNSIYATSRLQKGLAPEEEKSAFVFSNYQNENDINNIGYGEDLGTLGSLAELAGYGWTDYYATKTHDYLVRAYEGGMVYTAGDSIHIVPGDGMKATVRLGDKNGNVIHYTEGESYCALPEITSDSMEIHVVFTDSTPSDVDTKNFEAKISDGYYFTVEEAVAVANTTSKKETVTVTVLKDAEIASDMEVTGNVTITNIEGANVTISRAADLTSGNVFSVSSGATLTIVGTTDMNSIVLDGKAISSTVPLVHSDSGTLSIINTTLQNAKNTSEENNGIGTTGVIYAAGGILTVENSKFIGNVSSRGAAIRIATNATATITKCVFGEAGNENEATVEGGAIYNQGTLTIVDTQFLYNTAGTGGAVYNNGGSAVVKNSKFTNNIATGNGGAIHTGGSAGKLKLIAQNDEGNSTWAIFENNESQGVSTTSGGGAINMTNGTLKVKGYTFSKNQAKVVGGAIRSTAGTRTITGATFIGNYTTEANGYGGAICVRGTGATMTDCVFRENYTSGSEAHGGAVYLTEAAADTVITTPTYTDNAVIGEGAEGPDIYIEGIGSGTTPAGGLNGKDLGSGGEDDEIIEF